MKLKTFLKYSYCLVVTLLWAYGAKAQPSHAYLSQEEAREDLIFFNQGIHEYQAAFGVFHDTTSYYKLYNYIWKKLSDSISVLDFNAHIVRLSTEIREGHTIMGDAKDSTKSIYQNFFKGYYKFLPLHVKYVEGGVRVWRNFSPDSTLERGDRILEINGTKVEDIIRYLATYTITDANITSSKRIKLMANFSSHYFLFAERPTSFQLLCKSYKSENTYELAIPALSRDSMIVWKNKRYGENPSPRAQPSIQDIYEFEIGEDDAYLNLKTFDNSLRKRLDIKPKKTYSSLFRQLKEEGIKNLVIDVRNNLGGRTEYVNQLLPFLLKKKHQGIYYQTTSWKGIRRKNKVPKPSKWAFKGQVYILTNGASFSNGSVVAAYAKAYANAIIIGEETGSRATGFAAGSRQSIVLPNSTIEVKIPRYLFEYIYPDTSWIIPNRGVLPDYEIEYTIEDLIKKKDRALEKVKALIKARAAE